MMSADVGPPRTMVAAWMTQRDGGAPAVVRTASPRPIGALAELSRCSASPAARAIAPATPPPCSSWVFAALAIASTSSVVMSTSRISTSAIGHRFQPQGRGNDRRGHHRLRRARRPPAVLVVVGGRDLLVGLARGRHGPDRDRLALDAELDAPVAARVLI